MDDGAAAMKAMLSKKIKGVEMIKARLNLEAGHVKDVQAFLKEAKVFSGARSSRGD